MANAEEPFNYFNYFTEVEERFQQARGTALFLMSPLDWALVETWKDQGIPLAAVLKGIDEAFDKWRQKKSKTHQVNSIAYCAQAVLEAARRMETPDAPAKASEAPFAPEELSRMLAAAAAKLPEAFHGIAESLRKLAAEAAVWIERLEELEQNLAALEEKMFATLRAQASDEELLALRKQVEAQIKPYRAKMSAADLMMTEKKFLDQRLVENHGLPRLSLFYLSA
jgi:chromosome segregation ATPase